MLAQNILLTTQIFMSTSIVFFAMYMLYIGKDPGVYLPIITAISGSWLPSPMQNRTPPLQNRALTRSITRMRTDPIPDIEQPLMPSN